MVKAMKQRYRFDGKSLTLQELYALLPKHKNKEILGSIIAQTACGLPIKLVFVQNRNRRRDWLVLLSTDLALTDAEIVRIAKVELITWEFLNQPKACFNKGLQNGVELFQLQPILYVYICTSG